MTFHSRGRVDGIAWNADGRSIIVSAAQATNVGSLWALPIDGGDPIPVTATLAATSDPTISAAHRMAYVHYVQNVSIWRMPIEGKTQAAQFIASDFYDAEPDYSPDGTHIAIRSDRSGTNEIWICRSDGTELREITNFNGPMTGSPRWSPDGRWLAFDSRIGDRADVYIVNVAGGKPIQVTRGTSTNSDNVIPSWSRDGRSIYFSSNRTGEWQIWRESIDGGDEVQLTTHGGFNSLESPDGSELYYVRDTASTSIWRMSLGDHPKDEKLIDALGSEMWGYWTVSGRHLYYLQRKADESTNADIFRMNLLTDRIEKLGTTQAVANRNDKGLAVSPDGRSLLFAQRDVDRSNIVIVDGWK